MHLLNTQRNLPCCRRVGKDFLRLPSYPPQQEIQLDSEVSHKQINTGGCNMSPQKRSEKCLRLQKLLDEEKDHACSGPVRPKLQTICCCVLSWARWDRKDERIQLLISPSQTLSAALLLDMASKKALRGLTADTSHAERMSSVRIFISKDLNTSTETMGQCHDLCAPLVQRSPNFGQS